MAIIFQIAHMPTLGQFGEITKKAQPQKVLSHTTHKTNPRYSYRGRETYT